METSELLIDVIDKGGVTAIAVLLVWRLDRRLETLARKLTELVHEVREARRMS